MEVLVNWIVLLLMLGLVAARIAALRSWRGAWRWLALSSLLPAVVILAIVIIDGIADPTSHNLWPFEVVIMLALGLSGLGAINIIRLIVARLGR